MVESLFTDQARYDHPLAVSYVAATIFIYIFFFLYNTIAEIVSTVTHPLKMSAPIKGLMKEIKSNVKATKGPVTSIMDGPMFSSNIFNELSIEDLKV